ncbi:MAG: hypothetical protein WCP45_08200 [Verrucomicrobiota bacterium]
MKTLQVSKFKAGCLRLLKEVRSTGDPLAVTLRGKTLAIIQPPDAMSPQGEASVAATLKRLRPLLLIEAEDFEPAPRTTRPSATESLPI